VGTSVRAYSADNPFAQPSQPKRRKYSADNPFAAEPEPEERKPSLYSTVGEFAKQMVTAPIESARKALFAPVVGSRRGVGATGTLSNYGGAEAMGFVPRETDTVSADEQGAVTRREMLEGGAQTVANVAAGPMARGVGGTALKLGAKPLAARVAGSAVSGAAGGAAYSPDNPFVGAVVGAGIGAIGGLPGKKAPPKRADAMPSPAPAIEVPAPKTAPIPVERRLAPGGGNRSGVVNPLILSQLAAAPTGAAVGAAADKEDRKRGAIMGAATAMGITFAGGAAVKRMISSRRPDMRLITPQPMKPEALKVPVSEIDPSEFVNLGKFALDPTGEQRLRQQVQTVVQQHGMAPKTPVTWNETRAIARSIGIDDLQQGQASNRLGGAEMLAIRNVIAENTTQLGRAYKTMETSPLSSESREELTRSIAAMEAQNHSLLAQFIPARSQTGRDLNAMKILANATLDPAVWFAKAKRLRDGFDPTTDQMRQIGQFIEDGNRVGLIQYMGTLRTSTPLEKFGALRKAGLLTGPATQVRNTLGNLTMQVLETAKDIPATVMDNLAAAVTGIHTKSFSPASAAAASLKGAKLGLKEAGQVMRGIPLDDALRKVEIGHEVNFDNVFVDAYQKFVFRGMGAADRPFRQAAMMRSLDEQMRIAKATAPTNEMVLRAISDGEHAVFQNENVLGSLASGAKQAVRKVSPVAGAAADFVMPFTRTPGAVTGKVAAYSPLGAIKTGADLFKLYRAARGGKDASAIYGLQKQFAESAGRTATGSLAVLLGYDLARRKLMTPGTPTSQGERDTQSLVGEQADAVKVGNQWFRVPGLSPLGNLMAFGAHLYHDGAQSAALGIGKTIAEQPFLQGPQEILEGITRPDGAKRILPQAVGSIVPSLLGSAARATDPTIRDTRGDPLGPAKARIPFVSRTLPARVDQLGKPIKRATTPGANLIRSTIDPFNTRDDKTSDPVRAEVQRVGAIITQRAKKDAAEEPHSYSYRVEAEGTRINEVLRRLIESPTYQSADDMKKKDLIESRVSTVRGEFSRTYKADARRAGGGR